MSYRVQILHGSSYDKCQAVVKLLSSCRQIQKYKSTKIQKYKNTQNTQNTQNIQNIDKMYKKLNSKFGRRYRSSIYISSVDNTVKKTFSSLVRQLDIFHTNFHAKSGLCI